MSKRRNEKLKLLKSCLAAAAAILIFMGMASSTADAASTPTTRVYLRTSTRVFHHWVLSLPNSDAIECHIYTVTHDEPGHEDVLGFCGMEVYQLWLEHPVCMEDDEDSADCAGLILTDIGEIDQKLKTTIWLPAPEVSIEFLNCNAWEDCSAIPTLKVRGIEPLRNHHINSVHIEFENHTGLVCRNTDECQVDIPQTNDFGTEVIVYARSSYGDESEPYTFRARLMMQPSGDYMFQALYTDWDYLAPPESVAWGIFPDLDISDAPWLLRTESAQDIATEHDFALLAGRYILRGDVDISSCVYGGLTASGGASQCGLEQARVMVIEGQNQFDDLIIEAGIDNRIPPRIIKGVIAQESQFWTEWYFEGEYGLGMLTDEGIDMMLTWNPVAFLEICIPQYGADDCAWGYDSFENYPQSYLRGLALSSVGTDEEINTIAQTIVGAAAQAGQVVRNITRREPYEVLSYQDMWKVALGVYNSGVGCMFYAIDEAWDRSSYLTWGQISEYLIGDCQGAADYPNTALFNGVP